ncbi:MAG: c-type cytochrome [Rhodothalassiaceae bacterium]
MTNWFDPGRVVPAVLLGVFFLLLGGAAFAAPATGPGAALFESKGCSGCHSIGGEGGEVGPALDTVGDRYTAEWLFTWLKDPAAVKPGTMMPNLGLTDEERAHLVFYLASLRGDRARDGAGSPAVAAVRTNAGLRSNPPDLNPVAPENDYLALGSQADFVTEQRYTLQDQIQSFIPPNYEPAVTQSAFVLPPGSMRVLFAYRDATRIDEKDVFRQREIGARFADFDLDRSFLDFDLFLGLDDNFTLRLNLPVLNVGQRAELNPGFLPPVRVFPRASYTRIGDLGLFVKKKFVDQGNFPVGIAGVAAIRLPTGSHKLRFDPRTAANINGMDMLLPLPAVDDSGAVIPGTADGTFRRFTNDGRLPAPLQPGLGTVSGAFGLFVTRQFDDYALLGRGALHTGALYEVRPSRNGIDPGNLLTAFASYVKPLYRDNLSLDLSYIAKRQGKDSYAGKMLVPTPTGPMVVDRPGFSGGTTQFAAANLVIVPNPLFRITAGGLFRFAHPGRGPAPDTVLRLSLQYTFASGLFRSER